MLLWTEISAVDPFSLLTIAGKLPLEFARSVTLLLSLSLFLSFFLFPPGRKIKKRRDNFVLQK
jgi:hypothetical protein